MLERKGRIAQAAAGAVFLVLLLIGAFFLDYNQEKRNVSPDEQTELTVWVCYDMTVPGTYYVDYWNTLAEKYGCHINIEVYPTSRVRNSVRLASAGKDLPDIYPVWGGAADDYLFDSGAAVPVQKSLKSSRIGFRKAYVKPYKDGNNYIIPCQPPEICVTYANRYLMKRIGVTMPESWEDLLHFIRKVNRYNKKNGTHFCAIEMGNKDGTMGECLYDMMVNRIDPDALREIQNKTGGLENPVFGEAAGKLQQIKKLGAFPDDYMEKGETEAVNDFVNGESLLYLSQSTNSSYLIRSMGADAIDAEQFPCCSDTYRPKYRYQLMKTTGHMMPGLCISSTSHHKKLAQKLCMDYAREINQINVRKYGYLNMTTEKIQGPEHVAKPVRQINAMAKKGSEGLPYINSMLSRENGLGFQNVIKKLYAGEYSTKQFLEEAGKYMR